MDTAEILLTLEPLTFLGDDDDGNVDMAFFSDMEMSSRRRLGLLHHRSQKDIEEDLRRVLAKLGKRVVHGAKDQGAFDSSAFLSTFLIHAYFFNPLQRHPGYCVIILSLPENAPNGKIYSREK